MDIIAHRGFAEDNIENTIVSFKNAQNNCDYIELDIRSSSDNVPIVFHDCNLKRMCNVDKQMSNLNVKELNKYNILSTTNKIPTLKFVLEEVGAPLLVEIKDEHIVSETLKLCEKFRNEVIYQSFNPNIINKIPNSKNKLILCTPEKYLNKEGIPKNAITSLKEGINLFPNINGLSLHYSMINELNEIPDKYKVYVWTIRSRKKFEEIKNNPKIDGIITDSSEYIK